MAEQVQTGLDAFRRRCAARFSVTVAALYSDLDTNGHVNHARYLGYLEECRLAFRREMMTDAVLEGRAWPIAELTIRYIAPLFYPQRIVVELAPIAIGRTSYTLGYGIHTDEHCCAVALTRIVSVDTSTNKPSALPKAFAEQLSDRRDRDA